MKTNVLTRWLFWGKFNQKFTFNIFKYLATNIQNKKYIEFIKYRY